MTSTNDVIALRISIAATSPPQPQQPQQQQPRPSTIFTPRNTSDVIRDEA